MTVAVNSPIAWTPVDVAADPGRQALAPTLQRSAPDGPIPWTRNDAAIMAGARRPATVIGALSENDFYGTFKGCENRAQLAAYIAAATFEARVKGAMIGLFGALVIYGAWQLGKRELGAMK